MRVLSNIEAQLVGGGDDWYDENGTPYNDPVVYVNGQRLPALVLNVDRANFWTGLAIVGGAVAAVAMAPAAAIVIGTAMTVTEVAATVGSLTVLVAGSRIAALP